jgi:sarcosine oxidase
MRRAAVDAVVVGKGLVGAAAARHLAEAGVETLLVGPDEPADRATHAGVFASHHDAARITRVLDRDPLWAHLAAASLHRHGALEDASGTRFHQRHPVLFAAGPEGDLDTALAATAAALGADAPPHETAATPPASLTLPAGTRCVLETGDAGWIDPRVLVRAQVLGALAAGARVVRETVWALRPSTEGVRVILDDGSELVAARVLVAAGAFAAPVGLVRDLPLWTSGRTTVLARVDDDGLDEVPCLVMDGSGRDPADLYLMPPVRGADGGRWIKIGTGAWDTRLDALADLQDWFRGPPPPTQVDALSSALGALVPAVADAEHRTDICAVTMTASGRPLIGFVEPGVAVALGGNGKGAKSSDEIGRLAALALRGELEAEDARAFSP